MSSTDSINHTFLKEILSNHNSPLPAIQICHIRDLNIVNSAHYGKKQMGGMEKIDNNTLFQAGSISKTVFSLAVMKLIDRGKITLDEDINCYLSSWKLHTKNNKSVSLRHILSHTAALSVQGFPGYKNTDTLPDLIQILNGVTPANTNRVQIVGCPGKKFQYSGGGTTIAQQAIVDVMQQPFSTLMRELILAPAKMDNSAYLQPLPAEIAARSARGHDETGRPIAGRYFVYPELAAAGLWSTATDLAKLGIEVMKIFHGQKSKLGLATNTLKSMLQPQLAHEKSADHFVGLGWFCCRNQGNFCISHAGQTEGFIAQLSLLPEKGQGMAIMINALNGWPIIQRLLTEGGFSPASI